MSARKISARRIIQTLVTLVAVSGCVLALVSADNIQSVRKIKEVQIHIRNNGAVHFISEGDVKQTLFGDRHIDAHSLPLAKLDVHNMESIARSNPWISDAQVFVDNNRALHVYITQRVPAVRIFEASGQSYYLDTALQAVPLSSQYAHYTTVITNVPMLHNDSSGKLIKGTLVWLSQYITKHPFWNAQIAEVAMSGNNTFELIPVMGKQRILIGDTSRLDDKLYNLLSFYKQVQSKVGWDRYKILDVRYDGQVVASPALPWKAPIDKALSSMSWVKAIMDATPKDKAEAEPDTVAIPGSPQPAVAALPIPQQVAQSTPKPQKLPAVRAAEKPATAKHPDQKPKDKVKVPAVKKPDQKPKPQTKPARATYLLHPTPPKPQHSNTTNHH